MSITEVTDQTTYSFIFIVTPLEIISTKSIKNLKKSLLLKLGDKTQKTSQMNKPIQIPLEVLYSKTLKKYCPIKGIIKVYDINSDGSEVISSVGGFQTQQILNQQKMSSIIQRDIGTSKVKMKIQIKNLGIVDHKHHKTENKNGTKKQQTLILSSRSKNGQIIPQKVTLISSKNSLLTSQSEKQINQSLQDQNKRQKTGSQYFKRSSPLIGQIPKALTIIKKDSLESTNTINNNFQQNVNKQTISVRVAKQKELQKRQQIDNSYQNKQILPKNNKFINEQNSHQDFREQFQEYKSERDQTMSQFEKFVQCFESKNSKIWIEICQKLKTLNWKYKSRQFQKVFDDLFSFILKSLDQQNNRKDSQKSLSTNQKISKKSQTQIKTQNEDLKRRTSDNLSLRAFQRQKSNLEAMVKSKQRQCLELQNRIKQIQSFKKVLRQQNDYLREKDETMQQIISEKQTQIENLKQQMTEIQLQFKQMQAALKNDGCQIQELRQQVSNLNETIDIYRQKYGDLKNVKNRALQNELKQCLIWIDQQTRELQMSDFEQETEPSHSLNVSDIIKNIQLQGASREQMNSIKVELAGLIKRIDNFLAK